ncbi:MAG TPA: SprB repeat-containing protein, partial [Chitinophagales bacterium]|nr:SprB repeat-containing protein [Chitinophagales bacterium]
MNLTPVHALCYGAKNGSVSASVIGDGPFTFAWSNGKTTQNIANVGAGTYTVTVTDVDGDTSTASTSVNQPASIVAYVNCTKVCPGQCNGFATIVVLSGGTAPYTFQWSNGGTTTSITGLCPGVYWVTITDAIGCKKIVGAAVVEGTDVSVSGTTTNGTCADPCAGTISQTVSGAHAPYTYDWSDGANTKNRSGLCAGVYSVTVTSANGCTASATYTITAPTPVNVDVTVDNPACPGETGFASAIVSGGTAPFSFIWSNGSTAADLSGLNGGTYCVTLTDATGCTATDCGDIVDALGFSVTVDSTTCNPWPGTACAGTAAITANGGAAPYTYLWSNGSTGDYVTNLCTGTHSVVVTDNNGCTASTTVMVDVCPPVPCIPPITIVGSPVCGETSVTLSVVGGFNPATAIYAWTQAGVAGVIGTDATLEVTADGTYFVEVSDSITPCISDTFTTVTFIPNPTVSVDVTSVSCFGGENGSVSAIVSGGTAPYVYNWSTGGSSADASGLAAGIYCVTVIDANGCTATACGDVSEPSALNIDINGENGTCTNPCGGSVSVFANGGTAPYSYEWTGGLTTSSAQGLCAGEYCVTVIDTNGCSATGCVTIIAPAGISINVTSTNPTCYGKTNGSASVAVIGGTAPFSYNWSN